MIDALIQGRVHGTPQQRTGSSGKPFTTAKARVATRDGDAIFVNVICFSADAQRALLALGDGDSVALSGEMTPKVWTDKEGNARPVVDLLAHAVLTAYHVKRRRDAATPAKDSEQRGDEAW
jgi:single-stranded DNA-binding protein